MKNQPKQRLKGLDIVVTAPLYYPLGISRNQDEDKRRAQEINFMKYFGIKPQKE